MTNATSASMDATALVAQARTARAQRLIEDARIAEQLRAEARARAGRS